MDALEVVRREGDVFYRQAATADPELGVPNCPGWVVGDLVWHLGEVHWFWSEIIETRASSPDAIGGAHPSRPGEYADLVDWGRLMLDRLVTVLEKTDDDVGVWTWSTRQDVGFIRRHQVQETAVHRWDMQDAATSTPPEPIDAEPAADAIDEFLTYQVPFAVADGSKLPGTVHLHCTDAEGEWFVHENGRLERAHIKGDVALRGTASDLLLALYARIDLDTLDVIGNAKVATHFIESLDLD